MYKRFFFIGVFTSLFLASQIQAHCQMPCGIYHDQMIYDKIDEYFETMYKAVSAMKENNMGTVQAKNQFVRWVITKEKMSDEMAELITSYFLQQKIRPGADEDTVALVHSAHKMLFLLVQIKQQSDIGIVKAFQKEWENFKKLFHPEETCEERHSHDHEHDHDHDHDHAKEQPSEKAETTKKE